jgi:RNA polymerase sigma factor (sigma-70 family)
VQDALLQTLRRLSRFESRGQGALRGYLCQAVDNRLKDEFRRIGRRGVNSPLDDGLPYQAASPFDEALASEIEDRYRAALGRLKPSDRQLVVAHVELGYNNEQIALMTRRRRADSARVAVARALQRLAAEMDRG